MSEIEESGRSLWHSVKTSFHLDDYSKILNPDRPLSRRSSAAVQQFITSDPVHGPAVCSESSHNLRVFNFVPSVFAWLNYVILITF